MTGNCRKCFQGERSKVKVIARPSRLLRRMHIFRRRDVQARLFYFGAENLKGSPENAGPESDGPNSSIIHGDLLTLLLTSSSAIAERPRCRVG